jgi:imidazolonepropionase-like amidohydrolase
MMRNALNRLATLLLFAGLTHSATIRAQETSTAPIDPQILLRHVSIFDVSTGTMTPPQDILIDGGRIVDIGQIENPDATVQQIDCTGKFAVPGLFDCHTHLTHLTSGGDDSLKAGLRGFVARGITQVRDVGGPVDLLSTMNRRILAGEITGPEMFYTGPMLEASPLTWGKFNEQYPGFTVAIDSAADADSIIPELARQGAWIIKTFNNFDTAVYRHVVEVARRHSLKIVHDPGGPMFHSIPMDMALDLGVTSIEHAKAPWPVVLKDSLRAVHDSLLRADPNPMAQMQFVMKVAAMGTDGISPERLNALAEKMKEKNAFFCPTLLVLADIEEQAIEGSKEEMGVKELPEEALRSIKAMTGGMTAVSLYVVSQFAKSGVKMLVGQDGCNPAGTVAEMRMMKDQGVSAAEIIKGATIYPAQWLGVADRLGAIAPGKHANILVVDSDPLADIANLEKTFMVIQNGRVVPR